MDATVLVVSSDSQNYQGIKDLFPRESFVLMNARGLERARQMLPKVLPDVVLVGDEGLCENRRDFAPLLSDCELAEIPLFFFDGKKVRSIRELEPLCVQLGQDGNDPLWPVNDSLQISRLTRELHKAQEWLHQKETELEESLLSATHIQKSLVPRNAPPFSSVAFGWKFLPCQKVGGDLFNVVKLDESHVMIYALDVSGHGFPAAMVTVAISQSLSPTMGHLVKRPLAEAPYYELTSPAEILSALDREYPLERFEKFFTICYMLLNVHTGELRYSNAAAPMPLLVRADGTVERLEAGGTIVGMGGLVPFEESTATLGKGDRLFLFTDGLLEQENPLRDQYGEARLCRRLQELGDVPLGKTCDRAVGSVLEFSQGVPPQDDMTLLGFEFLGR